MLSIYFAAFLDSMLDNLLDNVTMNYNYSTDTVVEDNCIVRLQVKLMPKK